MMICQLSSETVCPLPHLHYISIYMYIHICIFISNWVTIIITTHQVVAFIFRCCCCFSKLNSCTSAATFVARVACRLRLSLPLLCSLSLFPLGSLDNYRKLTVPAVSLSSVSRVYPTVLRSTVNYDRPHIINQSVRADVAARCCHRRSPSCHLVSINTRKLSRAATAPKLSCISAQWCSQAIQCEICTEFKSKNSSAPTAIAWVRH